MNILEKIIAVEPEMSKKEKTLATYIEKNYTNILNLSIHELAKISGVSAATIIRFCKRLNLNGFPELKVQLSIIASQKDTKTEYDEIHPGEQNNSIKEKMKLRFKSVIDATAETLDDNLVKEAVNIIYNASQIQVFGVGASKLVAVDIYQKMLRLGKAINANSDIHVASTQLVNLPKDAVLIIISNSGKTQEAIDLANLAQESNIKTISLTSNLDSKLAKLSTLSLPTKDIGEPRIRSGATTSLISQFYVIDVLLFNYISTYPDEILYKLEKSVNATRKYKS